MQRDDTAIRLAAAVKERRAIVRLLQNEWRFYDACEASAFRGGNDERDRALYVLSEMVCRVRERK